MEKIENILIGLLKKSHIDKKVLQAHIIASYGGIVGKKISAVSRPLYIQNDILFVGVENSVWMHQLYLLKLELINKINASLPYPLLKDIKFLIRDIKNSERIDEDLKQSGNKNTVLIPKDILETIDEVSKTICDNELRNAFTKLMIKDAENKLKKEEKHCLST
ncbi:DUF721 domain-containing protein [Tepidanaerobacter syntrophicus]|uniref:DUF721 domain-containing protein n=1 Tax=Tepidanaerobacter syntrophicus TaxID=224999 RepID=A0A0U9HDG2_9FIRM|nr:DUF721 domain-containing protein [Tepidanaerobacter syntrophicus]GAQ24857.1 hypothetical protein TSYNT_6238 [Tepidanaerobacter syntrophicus]GLI18875.1 hypothetical protein TSYNTROPHJE_06880 [Tepidanaerobacter syntrophicus]